jgi:hypothetical protein|tara:strand:+ start:13856 stop:15466 length:1611 start_codon:yes stop_codon:yes gene_type:complete
MCFYLLIPKYKCSKLFLKIKIKLEKTFYFYFLFTIKDIQTNFTMNNHILQEDVQTFLDRIPSVLKLKGDEVVKNMLTKGSAGALDYSYIDDVKNIDQASAQSSIDAINRNISTDPSEEEISDSDKQISIIQNRLQQGQDTPKTNTLDYITEKLAEIYALPDGEMTSYGFPVTSRMKTNIIKGLTKMYDVIDRKGVFRAFLIGGKNSSRFGNLKPTLPRRKNGQIDWEQFNDLVVLVRNMISNEATIKKQLDYYIGQGRQGSFSSLYMILASKRYFDALRRMKAKTRAGDPDYALKQRGGLSGDLSLDDRIGDDGTTFADQLAATADSTEDETEIRTNLDSAFNELIEWLKINRNEGEIDSQIFKAGFIDGLKTSEMVDNPRYPSLTSDNMARLSTKGKSHFDYPTKLLGALKAGKFPSVMKAAVQKHLPHINVDDMNMKGLSFNVNKAATSTKPDTGEEMSADNWSQHDMDTYFATGKLPKGYGDDDEESGSEPETVGFDDVSDEELEQMLQERVVRRVTNIIAESLVRDFLALEL